ncbi:M10 family metallopeptidase [Microvirga pudoricolor]|uniref:M10 family metallopeptidase n=1 Tax=Microvirga pudoricolor TaxID=2778729 RepID=UPI00194E2D38|nr:M10 family metallopeptidase [Microvirga pudoricolor]MBM6593877.1 M10 family metallopeptidase [Microvirga pudoricolor]
MARPTRTFVTAGDVGIDALLSGYAWSGSLTYGFPDGSAGYGFAYGLGEPFSRFEPVGPALRQTFRAFIDGTGPESGGAAMTLTPIEGFTRLSFREAAGSGADLRVAATGLADVAYTYLPDPRSGPAAGDVWFGPFYDFDKPALGGYEALVALHEFGHAIGLKHPHEDSPVLPARLDQLQYTVMSYRSYQGQPISGLANEDVGYPQTYMMYDIAALQTLYGANYSFRAGPTTYRWDPRTGEAFVDGVGQGRPGSGEVKGAKANRIFETIWDGGGNDTFDLSNYANGVRIDLEPGGYSVLSHAQRAALGDGHKALGNVYNALQHKGSPRSLIENAKGGAGSDILKGNAAANRLEGGAGNDLIAGRQGKDVLTGGPGSDSFLFDTRVAARSRDTITDFSSRDDTMRLDADIFGALGKLSGKLHKGAFWKGAAAHDANDRILYNAKSGVLSYDPDGNGPEKAVAFASLSKKPTVTYKDFLIV